MSLRNVCRKTFFVVTFGGEKIEEMFVFKVNVIALDKSWGVF